MSNPQTLSRSEMKNVTGGNMPMPGYYDCEAVGDPGTFITVYGNSPTDAQNNADVIANSKNWTQKFPNGVDCDESPVYN